MARLRLLNKPKYQPVPDLSPIEEYVKKSIVTAQTGRKCVDGRYFPDQGTGMIARPGGDCGYVMALLAVSKRKKLGLSPEHCFNIIYKIVAKSNGFCMHTDHHADPDETTHNGLIGCGHLAKAANRRLSREYDVNSDDMKRIIAYARNLCEISREVHMINLNGEHQERGVLIIKSDKYSVLADNPELQQMYFIYDQTRDSDFIKMLVSEIGIEEVTYEDMKRESDLQLQATLHNLAQGLPMFAIEFEDKNPKITFAGFVSPKSLQTRLHVPQLPRNLLTRFHLFNQKN